MKQINARDFQKTFGQVTSQLQSGRALRITKHGKPLGIFIKTDVRHVKTPDFLGNVRKHTYPQAIANEVVREFYDSLS